MAGIRDLDEDAVPVTSGSHRDESIQMAPGRSAASYHRPGYSPHNPSMHGHQLSHQSQSGDGPHNPAMHGQEPLSHLTRPTHPHPSQRLPAGPPHNTSQHLPAGPPHPSQRLPAGPPQNSGLVSQSESGQAAGPNPGGRSRDDDDLGRDLLKGVGQSVESALSDKGRSSSSLAPLPPSSSAPSDLDSSRFEKNSLSLQEEEDVSDEDIDKYLHKMPDNLKIEYHDAMIIYYEEDQAAVQALIDRVHTDVLLLKKHRPRLVLYDKVVPGSAGTSLHGELDKSLEYCTFNLLYITKGFCSDMWTNVSSQICMMNAMEEKRWSVVPIFTELKRKKTFKIPPSINSLKGIQCWNQDRFYVDSLRKLLEDSVHIRLDNEKKHKRDRKIWIRKEKGKEARAEDKRRQVDRHLIEDEKLKAEEHQLSLKAKEAQHQQKQQEKRCRPIDIKTPSEHMQSYGHYKHDYDYDYLKSLTHSPTHLYGESDKPFADQQDGSGVLYTQQQHTPTYCGEGPSSYTNRPRLHWGPPGPRTSAPLQDPQFRMGPSGQQASASLQGPRFSLGPLGPQTSASLQGPRFSSGPPGPQTSAVLQGPAVHREAVVGSQPQSSQAVGDDGRVLLQQPPNDRDGQHYYRGVSVPLHQGAGVHDGGAIHGGGLPSPEVFHSLPSFRDGREQYGGGGHRDLAGRQSHSLSPAQSAAQPAQRLTPLEKTVAESLDMVKLDLKDVPVEKGDADRSGLALHSKKEGEPGSLVEDHPPESHPGPDFPGQGLPGQGQGYPGQGQGYPGHGLPGHGYPGHGQSYPGQGLATRGLSFLGGPPAGVKHPEWGGVSTAVAEPPLVGGGHGHHSGKGITANPPDMADPPCSYPMFSTAGPEALHPSANAGSYRGQPQQYAHPQGHYLAYPIHGGYVYGQGGYVPDAYHHHNLLQGSNPTPTGVGGGYPAGYAVPPGYNSGNYGYAGQAPWGQPQYDRIPLYQEPPGGPMVHHHYHHDSDRVERAPPPPTTTINYIKNANNVMIGQEVSATNNRGSLPQGEGQVSRRGGNAQPTDPPPSYESAGGMATYGGDPSSYGSQSNPGMSQSTDPAPSSFGSQSNPEMSQSMVPSPTSELTQAVTADRSRESSVASLEDHSQASQPPVQLAFGELSTIQGHPFGRDAEEFRQHYEEEQGTNLKKFVVCD